MGKGMRHVKGDAPENSFTFSIERLAGLGDGMGIHQGRKVFVPYTAPGDVVRTRMLRRTTDADHALLESVITPSPARVPPVCQHFTDCGGCSLQHLSTQEYTAFKQGMAQAAVRKAGFDAGVVAPLVTFPAASRRRVDMAVSGGRLGYFAASSHRVVGIAQCPVLEPGLEQLVLALRPLVAGWPEGESLQVNGLDHGYDIVFRGSSAPQAEFAMLPGLVRASWQHTKSPQVFWQAGEAIITVGGVLLKPPPGAFLQAVRAAQEVMTSLVVEMAAGAPEVIDVFSGIGTYSFPLARQARVMALEGDAGMVRAMQQAVAECGLTGRITAHQQDLFVTPVTARELQTFGAVVINPPRTGALAQCREIAAAGVKTVVMVSCNPATFSRDTRLLKERGYSLEKLVPIDQFQYSAHLELVAKLLIN